MKTPPLRLLLSSLSLLLAAAGQPARAQPAGGTAANPQEETIRMSAFEVTTTQGAGYVANNTDAGFKTVQSLIDIPQDIQVVTRDMIDAIDVSNSSTILQYFGAGGSGFMGEAATMRGYTAKYPYIEDLPENESYEDNFFVDSYVVIRGGAQVLYVLSNPVGITIKYMKKPLPFQQTLVSAEANSWGGTRVLLDNTGPIGQFGEVKLAYRFAAVQQGPSTYFDNVRESHEGLFPVIEAKVNNNTIVRFSSVYERIMHPYSGFALIAPDGKLLDAAGPREVNSPPDNQLMFTERRSTLVVDNQVSSNWDFRFDASYWRFRSDNPCIIVNGYNWAAQTENWYQELHDQTIDYWTIAGDGSGKWTAGPLFQQDNFGFAYEDTLTHQYYPAPFSQYWVNGAINAPLSSVAAINSLVVAPYSEFPALGSPGAAAGLHNQGYNTDVYWQHTIDIVPKYLTAVVGWTWANVATDSSPNVAVLPYNATVVAAAKWIHRFGAVFHPTKDVSVYALTSTGFAPPAGATPILYSGSLAPPQSYESNEVGFKTAFLDGRISSTFAVFKISETNLLSVGPGLNPEGLAYDVPIGVGVGEGEDGDIELAITPNWQFLVYGYAGHWLDQNGHPVPSSYDNSWSVFTRYAFPAVKGLIIGGGAKQIGGGFVSTAGVTGYTFAAAPSGTTQTIKVSKGFDSQLFVSYPIGKHFTVRAAASNLTNDHYLAGFQGAVLADEAPPLTFTLGVDAKF